MSGTTIKLSVLFVAFSLSLTAQKTDNNTILRTYDFVEEMTDLASEGKYFEALAFTENLPTGDTLYDELMAERCFHLFRDSNYTACFELTQELLQHPRENSIRLYILSILSLRNQEMYQEAVDLATKALTKYPHSGLLYYHRAFAYKMMEDFPNAYEDFKRTVYYTPLMADGHVQLGVLSALQDRWVEAALSLTMAVALYPKADNALGILQYIENVLSGEIESEIPFIRSKDDDDFSDIELILHNKVALDKKYKLKSKVDFKMLRQLQVMIETFGRLTPDDLGFFGKYYVPLFRDIYKHDHTEIFFYYLMQSVTDERMVKLHKKNDKKMDKFVKWAVPELSELNSRRFPLGKNEPELHFSYYGGNSGVSMMGEVRNGGKYGEWHFYHESGELSARGSFSENAERNGEWRYFFENGLLKEVENYVNGEANDTIFLYYPNGVIERKVVYDMGEPTEAFNYYATGVRLNHMQLKDGKRHGPYFHYHINGELRTTSNYKEGELEGSVAMYFDDGQLETVETYKDGKNVGEYIDYFRDSVIHIKGNFVDGERDGLWLTYHPNGNLYTEGHFENGKQVGKWTEYSMGGKRIVESNFENGELHGIKNNYDLSGRLYVSENYQKGTMASVTQYDADGNAVATHKSRKGTIDIDLKDVYGTTYLKGKLVDGKREGVWENHDSHGVKVSENTYVNDVLSGQSTYYYPNGDVRSRSTYEDGEQHGLFELFYKNGQHEQIGYYHKGKATDIWYGYWYSGTLKEREFYRAGEYYGDYVTYSVAGKIFETLDYPDGEFTSLVQHDTSGLPMDTLLLKDGKASFALKNHNNAVVYKGTYDFGTRHGYTSFNDGRGASRYEGDYHLGRRHGPWTYYYRNNKPSRVDHYAFGQLHGPSVSYYDNGKKEKEGEYVYGKPHGEWTYYFDNGKISQTIPYEYGVVHGIGHYYSPDGQLGLLRKYEDDLWMFYATPKNNENEIKWIPIGKEKMVLETFFTNGKPAVRIEMEYGDFNGKYERYYANGELYLDRYYVNGDRHGAQKAYHPNGHLMVEYTSGHDNIQGTYYRYHSNGKLKEERTYESDMLHGLLREYNTSGRVTHTYMYYNNVLEGEVK